MKKSDIAINRDYVLTDGRTVRVNNITEHRMATRIGLTGGHTTVTRYHCTNLATGRKVTVKSAVKFRYETCYQLSQMFQI